MRRLKKLLIGLAARIGLSGGSDGMRTVRPAWIAATTGKQNLLSTISKSRTGNTLKPAGSPQGLRGSIAYTRAALMIFSLTLEAVTLDRRLKKVRLGESRSIN